MGGWRGRPKGKNKVTFAVRGGGGGSPEGRKKCGVFLVGESTMQVGLKPYFDL